ncbi:hypothetical protein TRFO_16958 [Tritrichomonas foetus]|uniref:Uncharacterized protein n=1 Tax=Tritrichomonas foetus TaxID=1144522 RepID=A0A1J4KT80_9EUKA|nr:hypothetical protein TRFO_16958 [Tritrichomonas foetus]|eukprot:OHT12996.1 hypothetical protein TRFO_16958 [Tritrichomonas foetus]
MKMKPYYEQVNQISNKVENSITSNQNSISSLRDKINEITLNISSINQKCADNNDKIAQEIGNLRQETNRNNDVIQNRIQTIETGISQFQDAISTLLRRQQQFEQIVADQISQLSNKINIVSKISSDSDLHIMQQMEGLNRQTVATFTQMGQQIQSVSNALEESFSTFAGETKKSFEIVRNEAEESINHVESVVTQNSLEISNALKTIQGEVVDTIGAIANYSKTSTNAIQNAVVADHTNRKRNEQRIQDAYNTFTVSIAEQISNSARNVEKLENNQRVFVEQQCASYLATWKSDLSSFLKDVSSTVGECQKKSSEIEKKLNEYVVSVGKRQDEILDLVNQKSQISSDTNNKDMSTNEMLENRIVLLEKRLYELNNLSDQQNQQNSPQQKQLPNKEPTKLLASDPRVSLIPPPRNPRQMTQQKMGPFRPPTVKLPSQIANDDKLSSQPPSVTPSETPRGLFKPQQQYQKPVIDPKFNSNNIQKNIQQPTDTEETTETMTESVTDSVAEPEPETVQTPEIPEKKPKINTKPEIYINKQPLIEPRKAKVTKLPEDQIPTSNQPTTESKIPEIQSPSNKPFNPEDQIIKKKNDEDDKWPETPVETARRRPQPKKKPQPTTTHEKTQKNNETLLKKTTSPRIPKDGSNKDNPPNHENKDNGRKKDQDKKPEKKQLKPTPAPKPETSNEKELENNDPIDLAMFNDSGSLSEFSYFKEPPKQPPQEEPTKKGKRRLFGRK